MDKAVDTTVWMCQPFDALNVATLYKALALRQAVFVVEQQSIYLDADGYDPAAQHLFGWRGDLLAAYARLLPPGTKYAEWSIGRVVVDAKARGQGLGKAVMLEALRRIAAIDVVAPVRIQAQAYLADKFYAVLGFAVCSEVYEEDGIPHVEMMRGGRV